MTPSDLSITLSQETGHGTSAVDMKTTTQADFIARTADPEANKKSTTIGNLSNVQMGQERDGEEETRQMISTYDLSISQVQGPKRVDTVLWSGVTKRCLAGLVRSARYADGLSPGGQEHSARSARAEQSAGEEEGGGEGEECG
eukprot:767982-Hanusia_phi.AAC.1